LSSERAAIFIRVSRIAEATKAVMGGSYGNNSVRKRDLSLSWRNRVFGGGTELGSFREQSGAAVIIYCEVILLKENLLYLCFSPELESCETVRESARGFFTFINSAASPQEKFSGENLIKKHNKTQQFR